MVHARLHVAEKAESDFAVLRRHSHLESVHYLVVIHKNEDDIHQHQHPAAHSENKAHGAVHEVPRLVCGFGEQTYPLLARE